MKKLVIEAGNEYRAKIEKQFERNSFFYEVYYQAHAILAEMEKEVQDYYKSDEKEYQRIGNNIIAFSSTRGQGKTSALQSFARYLKKNKEDYQNEKFPFPNLNPLIGNYYVLKKTIDPSTLNESESIVRVLISRLFDEFREGICEKVSKRNALDVNEIRKKHIEILELFQTCYNNIDNILGNCDTDCEKDDLDNLAQLGSSSKLRANLSNLVTKILEYNNLGTQTSQSVDILVIPIDDADLSMQNTYKICEEIRTYFESQNIIILMAADFGQIEYAIEQVYIKKHSIIINAYSEDKEEYLLKCHNMAAKYVEKLFPSGHRIELPKIDNFLSEDTEKVIMEYIEAEDSCFKNEISDCEDLQEQLLRLLYNRTGMIFMKKEAGMNPVLPVTLRELNHFIKMMKSMEVMDERDIVLKKMSEIGCFSKSLLEKNLSIFEQYFLDYWCPNRLNEVQQELFSEIHKNIKNTKEVKKLIIRYVEKHKGSFIGNAKDIRGISDNYLDVVHVLVSNITGIQKEEEFKQAIYIYYTIFLNKWIANSWGNSRKMKQLGAFIGHSFYIPQRSLNSTYGNKYNVYNFVCDARLLKALFPLEEETIISFDYLVWLRQFCEITTKEEYPDYMDIESKMGLEIDWIESLKVNILDLFVNSIANPTRIVNLKSEEVDSKSSVQKNEEEMVYFAKLGENLNSSQLMEFPRNSNEDKNIPALLYVKNILVNLDIQFYLSNMLEKTIKRFHVRKGDKPIASIYEELYKEIDDWKKEVGFLGLESSTVTYFTDYLKLSSGALSRLFLCNWENMEKYCEALQNGNNEFKKRIGEIEKEYQEKKDTKELFAKVSETNKEQFEPKIFTFTNINEDIAIDEELSKMKNVIDEHKSLINKLTEMSEKISLRVNIEQTPNSSDVKKSDN